jgi:hypothetical protein
MVAALRSAYAPRPSEEARSWMNNLRRWVGRMAVVAVAGIGQVGCVVAVEEEEITDPEDDSAEEIGEAAQKVCWSRLTDEVDCSYPP